MFINFVSLIEPKKVVDALKDIDWIRAMHDELNEFECRRVWTLVPQLQGKSIIDTRSVFWKKLDEDGTVTRNKSRSVAHGFYHLEGLDNDETFTPFKT